MAAIASSNTPSLAHRLVVPLPQAVDVHGEREVGRRLEVELVPALAHELGVGAQVDVLLALDQFVDHLVDLRVHQRLAAGDRHHRRAALLDRADRLLDRHALAQQVVRLLDLAAAVALEVAGEQRLQLDDQRELVPPPDLLLEQVPADTERLGEGGLPSAGDLLGRVNRIVFARDDAFGRPRPGRAHAAADDTVDQMRRRRRPGGDADARCAPAATRARSRWRRRPGGPASRRAGRPRPAAASWRSWPNRRRSRARPRRRSRGRRRCRLVVA